MQDDVHRCGTWGSESVSSLPEVTWLISGNAKLESRSLCDPENADSTAMGDRRSGLHTGKPWFPVLSTTDVGSWAQRAWPFTSLVELISSILPDGSFISPKSLVFML